MRHRRWYETPGKLTPVLLPLLLLAPTAPPALPAAQDTGGAGGADFTRLAESGGLKATGAFPFDYQYLVFSGPSDDLVDVWAAVSVHAGRVRGVFEGGWKYSLGLRFDLLRDDALVASETTRVEHTLNALVPESTSDGFPLQARVRVPPGKYRYRIAVTDHNWEAFPAVNEKTGEVTIPSLAYPGPVVSSIAVAADSGGTWLPAKHVSLKLNAARIVRKESRPFIYFEAYGVTPGAVYRGEVKLISTWASTGQGETFRGSRRPFQLQYRGTAPTDPNEPIRSALRLDLSKTEPGPYVVTVKITDLATGRTSDTRRVELKVRTEKSRGPPLQIREVRSRGVGN